MARLELLDSNFFLGKPVVATYTAYSDVASLWLR
jgi:hypothetical protein